MTDVSIGTWLSVATDRLRLHHTDKAFSSCSHIIHSLLTICRYQVSVPDEASIDLANTILLFHFSPVLQEEVWPPRTLTRVIRANGIVVLLVQPLEKEDQQAKTNFPGEQETPWKWGK